MNIMQQITGILSLKKNDEIIVNEEFKCILEEDSLFNAFHRQSNCIMYSSYAKVKVEGYDEVRLMFNVNVDLTFPLQLFLIFYDNNKNISSIDNIVSLKKIV